ncbi:MAG: sulfatase-like hydrolase/transferase [Chitinophagales bacterium]
MNFKYCFPALSLCEPSRASIVTGLYPHHHGVTSNALTADTFLHITIAQILHDAGYYTGFIGKYGFEKFPVPGWDYYCQSSNDPYWNAGYQYNQKQFTVIAGHKTNVFTYKAFEFLESVPQGNKWCLFLAHKAPHVPLDPRAEDSTLFKNTNVILPPNRNMYTKNFPSTYWCNELGEDSSELVDDYRSWYELIEGGEWSVDTILHYLDQHNITDSTLIIFTSDNGLLKGEHMLGGKELALDESIRLPMFIRYPKWFAPHTQIDSEFVMNIDIAPTLLDAAGIPDTFGMDGTSIRAFVDGEAHRRQLFYEFFYRGANSPCNPTFTAVRDFKYIYIQNGCTSSIDEFYDLTKDSLENENLINAPNYFAKIDSYKTILANLKVQYDYINLVDTLLNCYNPNVDSSVVLNVGIPVISTFASNQLVVYPNPTSTYVTVDLGIITDNGEISIYNTSGQLMYHKADIESYDDEVYQEINVSKFPPGYYVIKITANHQVATMPFVKVGE